MHYPLNYGFVPRTLCDDGDPLDILLLSDFKILPGAMLEVRPIATLQMIDCGEADDKVIAVSNQDPNYGLIEEVNQINKNTLLTLKHFFRQYKTLDGKKVAVEVKEDILNTKDTLEVVEMSIEQYKKKFP